MLLSKVVFALVVGLASRVAFAGELQSAPLIFDVRINLPLDPEEQTYHDFYFNAGVELGFKKGMFVTVVRPVPVHDPIQNKQQGTLHIAVARLQVIHVERNLTVARLVHEFTDEDRPVLEFESVMIGDRIDPASMTMEGPTPKKKKGEKTAAARPEARDEVKPEPRPEAKPAVKSEAVVEKLPSAISTDAGGKKPSPESPAPDMVRLPIPAGSTRAM